MLAPLRTLRLRMGQLEPDAHITVEGLLLALPSNGLFTRRDLIDELPAIFKLISNYSGGSWSAGRPFLDHCVFATALFDPSKTYLSCQQNAMWVWVSKALLSPDINTIVADCAQIDLSSVDAVSLAKSSKSILEPVVGLLITLNGILLGLQTDPYMAAWPIWLGVQIFFTVAFLVEAAFKMWRDGIVGYFRGPEWRWNNLDFFIVLTSLADVFFTNFLNVNSSRVSLLRFVRLTKLTRLVRLLHITGLKELHLMVRGLFAGMKTLVWAIVLLFFFVYICGIIMTDVITRGDRVPRGEEFEDEMNQLFGSLPAAMITTFRCLIGDCATSQGKPTIGMLIDAFGLPFALGYVLVVMLVTFGLFNLIMAIYLENTLAAARQHDTGHEANKHVAQLVKELLRIFCTTQKHRSNNMPSNPELAEDDNDVDCTRPIQRQTYMQAITCRRVQRIMDTLEIESDRARLFDVIDADGNQSLSVREFVQGLLRLRGEAQRSDVLASVLGVRAVLDKLRELDARTQSESVGEKLRAILKKLNEFGDGPQQGRWDSESEVVSAQ
eukprot:NODE_245_length_1757_cov_111.855464.p1 GENE.NODE_245_length_1757_cov_111.855464~~NODE_245_length_1757_cov_111.855464.p1  ORF type:complete len:573 (+),score=203.28 NODE_245_length_1757_cov_111.855464:65-1720(+)